MRRSIALALWFCLALAPLKLGAAELQAGMDLSGSHCCEALSLIDQNGAARKLSDFKGNVVIVSFGYTHCPDVCPTTLFELDNALKQLGKQAREVKVLFITVDPERDTPAVLKDYVGSFDPDFIGLSGTSEETNSAAKEFRVFYQKSNPSDRSENYSLDHTAGIFVIDRDSKIREFIPHGWKIESLVADLRTLLGSQG
ncbi:BsSco OS=Afipia felis OX=1035 GN=ypmQ PE=3 SV=1 [Afipia felis]